MKYLLLGAAVSVRKDQMKRIIRTILLLIATALLAATAQATIIDLGEIDLTGNFTLNHTYNFNDPSASPFGTFGQLTVQSATGIFAPYVSNGDSLAMNTPFMFGPISPTDWTVSQPMTWSIGGFTIDTQYILITGADFVGRNCSGGTDLSGNGFDPNAYPFYPFSFWDFIAPPYDISNFPEDITGPINMTFALRYDDHEVIPDNGPTALLLAIAITLGVAAFRRKLVARGE
jgi:hypothetical protein